MSKPLLQLVHASTRLTVVTETWPPEINGVAHTISRMVEGLRGRGGYQIQLVRPRQLAREKARREDGFHEYLVNGLTLPFYKEVRLGFPQYHALKRLWKKQRPDIVQIVTEGPLGYSAMKAAKKLGIPVISDFHTNFDQYSRYYRLSGFFNLAKRYLRHVHNQTLVTLVPTRELQQQLAASGYTRVGILERGIDTRQFNPQRRNLALRQRLGVRDDQLLVTLVSRMAQEKNLDLAFVAFRTIQQHVPDAQFLLVGDGPERKRLQEAHPDCLFAGMQTGTALAEHYASGDLFLYPSTSETFGNVVLEAMASGLPVVTFHYAAAYEHIRHADNGMAVPLDDNAAFIDASLALARDPVLRQQLGECASQTALGLSWEKVVERLDNTIQTVLREVRHETAPSA
ncbi:MAG TPA: glycosyltransferase family 1 protein [Candidatus Thiothrix moscowensis]|uniref:glycosyltransferase family 4 protein n=1 Tax=unclassified Thiothrix TaxID=2636184 RepID=UPI0025D016ED|nr:MULTISPECIES: glycosyltransferase family 1 protein [unclassified Thiothrix]HRJ54332.1 glycosyltransferase family 1 protein [Candidatus Thiothrix moscowensis]HRJ94593.1 glycosyltransferase family 1 protein [Candidatus Thiothrix moscowensis]